MAIQLGVKPPARSRTFTEKDAQDADKALRELATQNNTSEGVGYGLFGSAESARSAGVALNRLILDLKINTQKWATTVYAVEVDGEPVLDENGEPALDENGEPVPTPQVEKYQGVMLAKPAKVAPPRKGNGKGGKKAGK